MKQYTVRAEKAPTAEDSENWDIKLTGMNVQQAKEWTGTTFGRNWTIRYTMPSDESYPCFLLAKRSGEKTGAMLAAGTADYLEHADRFKIKSGSCSKVAGYSYTFILVSNATD